MLGSPVSLQGVMWVGGAGTESFLCPQDLFWYCGRDGLVTKKQRSVSCPTTEPLLAAPRRGQRDSVRWRSHSVTVVGFPLAGRCLLPTLFSLINLSRVLGCLVQPHKLGCWGSSLSLCWHKWPGDSGEGQMTGGTFYFLWCLTSLEVLAVLLERADFA